MDIYYKYCALSELLTDVQRILSRCQSFQFATASTIFIPRFSNDKAEIVSASFED